MKNDTIIAANRFGLGARPDELANIDRDPKGWLIGQLQGPNRTYTSIGALPSTSSVLVEVQELREMRREAKRAAANGKTPTDGKKYGPTIRRHYISQIDARFQTATETNYPFHERLVHFWSNHFAVSADKQPIPAIAGLFENEAIRSNLGGKFYDLLLAVEKHPAMILYLDNQRSIGPNSRFARRQNRQVGLNENLAREILELHTLGVAGGYSQVDVTTFAQVITGWSIGGTGNGGRLSDGKPGTFHFRDAVHEPGKKTILNRTYENAGVEQGEAVLRDLATNVATAEHIATKLVRHFVSDNPPPEFVTKIAGIFLDSGGDLPTVHAALVNSREAWQSTFAKYKTPQDFFISAFRAFRRSPENGQFIFNALDTMGQAPYRPGSPAGWPDTAAYWGGADALYKRIEWSNTIARFAATGDNPLALADAVLGPALGDHTRLAVSRAESIVQGTTLLLASPDFQRR